jgi:hypothetical protein
MGAVGQHSQGDIFESIPLIQEVCEHVVADCTDLIAVRLADPVQVRGVEDDLACLDQSVLYIALAAVHSSSYMGGTQERARRGGRVRRSHPNARLSQPQPYRLCRFMIEAKPCISARDRRRIPAFPASLTISTP